MAYSLEEMEKYLQDMYEKAGKDLEQKAVQYMLDFQRLEEQHKRDVQNGKWTQEQFDTWRKNKLLYGTHWTRMIQTVQRDMAKVNQTALDYINGKIPQIFAQTYNEVAEKVPKSPVSGYSFELVNADTVKNLIHEEGIILPPKKNLDKQKDKLWNAKQVNAQLLQGILQGESIKKIAARMQNVANADLVGATRTARTMCTAAENSGRQSAYNRAAEDGIKFTKTWLAALQGNTRDTHKYLNQQTQPHDKPFESSSGAVLMFPGDWHAPPAEVYNCRCTMITNFKGFDKVKLKEAVERQQKEAEKTAKQTETPVISREELMEQVTDAILHANIDWDNAPDFMRSNIIESIENCPEYLLSVISDTMPNLNSLVFVDNGTSHYTFGTGNIVICINGRGASELIETFWHEYGHYIDDGAKSGSGYGYTQIFENSRLAQDENGNIIRVIEKEEHSVNRIKSILSIYDVYGQRYQTAVSNDVNRILKNQKLDKIFEVRPSSDEYGHQYILKNGEYYDTVNTVASDTEKLHRALKNEINRITGRTELDNFMVKNGMPREPMRENYYNVKIKNGEVKLVEAYTGARNDYESDYAEYVEKLKKFQESEKYEQLRREQSDLRLKVYDLEDKISHVTDTLDAGCFGLFNSVIEMGGHTPEYYVDYGLSMDEQIANVFMSEVLQDKAMLELNNTLNAETYDLIKGVLKNERNFK